MNVILNIQLIKLQFHSAKGEITPGSGEASQVATEPDMRLSERSWRCIVVASSHGIDYAMLMLVRGTHQIKFSIL